MRRAIRSRAQGNIGAAQLTLDNAGLIAATQAGALTLNLQAGSTNTNTGTLRAEAGRTMTLAGAPGSPSTTPAG
jgi:hypothetical protein